MGMKAKLRWILLFWCTYVLTLYAEPTNDDWVRVYDHQVLDIYTIADISSNNESPMPLNKVIVVLDSQMNSKAGTYNTKDRFSPVILSNFQTKAQSKKGCIYGTYSDFLDGKYNIDGCEIVQRTKNIDEDYTKCRQINRSNYFFVALDLSETLCLHKDNLVESAYKWISPSSKQETKILNKVDVTFEYKKTKYKDSPKFYQDIGDIQAYFNVQNNKLFSCSGYGVPVSRLEIEVPKNYVDYELPRDEKGNYVIQIHDQKALWQKQYLIRTEGFRYCWDSWRIIDEPKQIGLNLRDGTLLLQGNSSVIRIRYEDGTTQAFPSIVQVQDAKTMREKLNEYGAQNCTNVSEGCDLTTMPANRYQLSEADFYKAIIEAADKIIQDIFQKGDK